ncbi:MAG: ABC transporter substrate-binding protein [Pseudomonadota bacterium]|nr:ABC transporter substrate-binding protein [Pseudomonadota bacterium]
MISKLSPAIRLLLLAACLLSPLQMAQAGDFDETLAAARNQTVYFNAWGGDDKINDYIAWAGEQLHERHGITLVHVKLADTAAAVGRILAEKSAGRTSGGSVDLLWVNGENFAAMKRHGLLQDKAWAENLPSWRHTDAAALPAIRLDFAEPTEGRESPWGRAQLVFAYDSARTVTPPRDAAALADFIAANPGRFTYPQPPDFVGLSFLKQILLETATDTAPLYRPVEEADFEAVTAPLWAWLDAVTPNLWRNGRAYPFNYPTLRQLLGDGEVDIAIAFNPSDASAAISRGELPASVRTYIHDGGTLANVHFLAIPMNANAPEGARVVADFMLSPEAQLRKADPNIWGDPTVLAMHRLEAADRAAFEALPRGAATLSEAELGATLAEPHPSWVAALEAGWRQRYGSGG